MCECYAALTLKQSHNRKSELIKVFVNYVSYPLFFCKIKSFEVSSFGGSLFSVGDRYFWDLLTPVTFYRYFRGVVTFGTLRYQDTSSLLASSASITLLIREGPSEHGGLILILSIGIFQGLKSKLICFHGELSDPPSADNHKCTGTVRYIGLINFKCNHYYANL